MEHGKLVGSLLWVALGGSVLLSANVAHAAFVCEVPLVEDPYVAAAELSACVDEVNEGWVSEIVFEGPQTYELKVPLVLERDVTIHGTGQVLQPRVSFSGDSLIVVGTDCSAPCANPIKANLIGLELQSPISIDVRAIEVSESQELVLDSATITDFEVTAFGGGILADPDSTVIVLGGTIQGNYADEGGAIHTQADKLYLSGTVVRDNEATLGGGIRAAGAGKVTIQQSTLESNLASTDGGALHTSASATSILHDSTLSLNDAGRHGGGLYGGADVTQCLFDGNTAVRLGGGAYLRNPSEVRSSTFDANSAYRGGGIAIVAAGAHDTFVEHSTLVGNTAVAGTQNFPNGGGIYAAEDASGSTGTIFLRNSTVSGNSIPGNNGFGGGLSVARVAVVVEHATFFDNDAPSGGSIFASGSASSSLVLDSSIVAGSPGTACVISSPVYQTTTSLDDDGSCGVDFGGIDPGLGVLADNGGFTWTHLPSAPEVLDAATCFSSVDQRFDPRPSSACDVGSVEQ